MLTEKFDLALLYAARTHRSQVRKSSGVPYLSHLLSVASLVIEHHGTEDQVIAALLHDAVEDWGASKEGEIRGIFGHDVAFIVMECSDCNEKPKPPWRPRKEKHLEFIRNSISASGLLVTVADKLHNVRNLLDDYRYARLNKQELNVFWKPFNGGKNGTIWYYKEMVEAILIRAVDLGQSDKVGEAPKIHMYWTLRMHEELKRVVGEIESLVKRMEPEP